MGAEIILTVVLLTLVFLLYILLRRTWGSGKLPNGPPTLPIIGNIHQVFGKDIHLKFCKWSKVYGKLFTIQLGNKRALVISDPKLLKDLFSLPASTGRFKMEMFQILSRGDYGIVNAEGNVWNEQKNFCIKTLKTFALGGVGKTVFEQQILQDIEQEVLENILTETEPVNIYDYIKRWQSYIMWKIIYGGDNETAFDENVIPLTNQFLAAMGKAVETGFAFVPWLKYIEPEWSGYNGLKRSAEKLHEFVTEKLDKKKDTLFVKGSTTNIMEAYVENLKECDDPKSSFYGKVGRLNTIAALIEIVGASGDTIPHTINWLMLYLAHNQSIQQKLCEEIDQVIGSDRAPSLLDRKSMPYCEAVIQETLRKSSMVWMGAAHQLLEEVEFEGYTLPDGLILLPNLYYMHHDSAIWGDPEKFRPERFISKEGTYIRNNVVMPFGVGKRMCFGENMARELMFLFVAKFFQAVQIFPDSLNPTPDFHPNFGMVLTPKPFKVVVMSRSKKVSS